MENKMGKTKYFYYVVEIYYKTIRAETGVKGSLEGIRECGDGYLDVFTIQEEIMIKFSNVKSSLIVNTIEIKEEQYRKLAEKITKNSANTI
jgi:hypothetical protein